MDKNCRDSYQGGINKNDSICWLRRIPLDFLKLDDR